MKAKFFRGFQSTLQHEWPWVARHSLSAAIFYVKHYFDTLWMRFPTSNFDAAIFELLVEFELWYDSDASVEVLMIVQV